MLAQTISFGGFKAIGIFLFFGTVMAFVAGTTLVWPGTFLDRLWMLNTRAYTQLAPLGYPVGIAFLLLGTILALAGVGWFLRHFWGWFLAVIVVATQVVGNFGECCEGRFTKG